MLECDALKKKNLDLEAEKQVLVVRNEKWEQDKKKLEHIIRTYETCMDKIDHGFRFWTNNYGKVLDEAKITITRAKTPVVAVPRAVPRQPPTSDEGSEAESD
jgi:hypothetical protein